MFVCNDVTVDARVLKEAASLRDAGHAVTIIGITAARTAPRDIEREQRDGFEIVRVPLPSWRRWWRWLRAPSRALVDGPDRGRSVPARRARMDGLDWLAMWRFGTLGWARGRRARRRSGRRLPRPRPDRPAGRRSTPGVCATGGAPRLRQPRALHRVGGDGRAAGVGRGLARAPRARVVGRGRRARHGQRRARRRSRPRLRARAGSSSSTTARPPGRRARSTRTNRDPGGARHSRRTPASSLYTGGLRAGPRPRGARRGDARAGPRGRPPRRSSGSGRCARTRASSPRTPGSAAASTSSTAVAAARCRAAGSRRRTSTCMPIQAHEPELRAVDAEQAVRGVRGGRAGRRERLSRDAARSSPGPGEGRSASCATRRRRRRSRAAIRRLLELPPPRTRRSAGRAAGGPRSSAGTGRRSRRGSSSCTAISAAG